MGDGGAPGRAEGRCRAGDVIYVEPIERQAGDRYACARFPEISGAHRVMDPYTGRVLAMVGGFSFDQSEFNRATQALRQPGSSFKPFVYAAALDNGYTPSSIVLDAPIEIDQGTGRNLAAGELRATSSTGRTTLRFGIEHSRNLMTVRLAQDIGMPLVAEYAKRFGIYDDLPPFLSMSLGAGETTVLQAWSPAMRCSPMAASSVKPTLIDRIQDRWGHTIYKHDERDLRGLRRATSWKNQDEPKLIDKREQVHRSDDRLPDDLDAWKAWSSAAPAS